MFSFLEQTAYQQKDKSYKKQMFPLPQKMNLNVLLNILL